MKWTVLIPWTDDHISEEDIVKALQTHIDPDVVDGIFDRYKDLINSNTPFDDFIFDGKKEIGDYLKSLEITDKKKDLMNL